MQIATTNIPLILSNLFITIAWSAHVKEVQTKPKYIAALVS